jgi:uncharacterized membrane protein
VCVLLSLLYLVFAFYLHFALFFFTFTQKKKKKKDTSTTFEKSRNPKFFDFLFSISTSFADLD